MTVFPHSKKKVFVPIGTFLLCCIASLANGQINVSLNNPSAVFMLPQSGTADYSLTGTVSVTSNFTYYTTGWSTPFDAFGDSIHSLQFDSAFNSWFDSSTRISAPYAGKILDFTIASTQPTSDYFLDYLGHPLSFSLGGDDPGSIRVSTDYSIDVIPYSPPPASTPEPGAIAMVAGIGVTAVFGIRQRKRTN